MYKIENNAIKLTGEVDDVPQFSHEVFGEKFYTFPLKVNRLSQVSDSLPITISERLVDIQSLLVGETLTIEGQLRSFNKHEENKNRLVLSVFARDLFSPEDDVLNYNELVLEGYICKAPVYRKTPLGREIADVLVAVNRTYGKSDYIPCICWGRNAKFVEQLEIGTKVSVTGRFQSRQYQKRIAEDKFETHTAYEVSVSKILTTED